MNEIEAWKVTGRRALRIARQRGLTLTRTKVALVGAAALALGAALSHAVAPPMHQARFERHVVVRHYSPPFLDLNARSGSELHARLEAQQAAIRATTQARQEALRAAAQARQEAVRAAEQARRAALDAQRGASQP